MSNKKYIDINGIIYVVKKLKDETKLKKGYAYQIPKKIFGESLVLPYLGKLKDNSKLPGIYLDENKTMVFKRPLSKNKSKKYSAKNIYEIDLNSIENIIANEGVRKEQMTTILGETDEVFAPPISEDDNMLQQMIKRYLQLAQIDIKNYAPRFNSPSDLNNNKRSLLHHGKMSFEKFINWVDVFDLNFEIRMWDSEDSPNPIGEEIYFRYK